MVFNTDKTKYMIFSKSKKKNNIHEFLYYRNINIDLVHEISFLGVILDDNLTWNQHVSQICKKMARSIGVLSKINYLPVNILKAIYHTLITPYLSYCNIVWGFTSNKNINYIYLLQKRAVRIITHSSFLSPTAPIFKDLSILPIQKMITLQCGTFMFSCHNNCLPIKLQKYFVFNSSFHSYYTRNSAKYHLPLMRTSASKNSIFYHGPVIWNNLADSLKDCKSICHFKTKYKKNLNNSM